MVTSKDFFDSAVLDNNFSAFVTYLVNDHINVIEGKNNSIILKTNDLDKYKDIVETCLEAILFFDNIFLKKDYSTFHYMDIDVEQLFDRNVTNFMKNHNIDYTPEGLYSPDIALTYHKLCFLHSNKEPFITDLYIALPYLFNRAKSERNMDRHALSLQNNDFIYLMKIDSITKYLDIYRDASDSDLNMVYHGSNNSLRDLRYKQPKQFFKEAMGYISDTPESVFSPLFSYVISEIITWAIDFSRTIGFVEKLDATMVSQISKGVIPNRLKQNDLQKYQNLRIVINLLT